tara:strand:+ start:1104 stop:1346 length:243 start_codon:yes stop_codon:yes gene_type:complete
MQHSHSIYTYSITTLSPSQKVRFVYALRGRPKSTGLIHKLKGEFLTDSCFLLKKQHDPEMIIFLKYWKIPYKKRNIVLIN